MKNNYTICICLLFSLASSAVFADGDSDSTGTPNQSGTIIQKKNLLRGVRRTSPNTYILNLPDPSQRGEGDDKGVPITFEGALRFQARWRYLYDNFPGEANIRARNLELNGFGSSEMPITNPFLGLFAKFTPSPGIDLGIGLGLSHIFAGTQDPDSTRGRTTFGQTFGANIGFKTKIGNIRIGGGNLQTGLSQMMSSWSNVRWNSFHRLPWDVSAQWGGSWEFYEGIYRNGGGTNFDSRYTSGGRVQGVIMQFSELPGDFGLNLSYGVTGQTGLYFANPNLITTSDASLAPTKKTFGARMYKKQGAHIFALNAVTNNGYVEEITNVRESQFMGSGDTYFSFENFTLHTEVGVTYFEAPFGKFQGDSAFYKWTGASVLSDSTIKPYKSGTDMLALVKLMVDKKKFGIPISFTFYNMGANYVNANSGVFNTSTKTNYADYIQANAAWDPGMRPGFIADIGQYANNRRAGELVTSIEKGRFKINIATQVGTEIQKADTTNNQVMFYHKLNAWSRSSFNYWTPRGGAYQKLLGNYIQLLERVSINDSIIDYKKTFNIFDIETRYKTTLWGKSIIINDYMSYQSASDKFSPLPYFTDNAFVRVFYNEINAYYQIGKKTVWITQLAYNQAKGNKRTELADAQGNPIRKEFPVNGNWRAIYREDGKPIDQKTFGVGMGIDWNFAPMMGLYFREFWMTHNDKNFTRDRFEGFETTVEIKVMF